MNKEETNQKLQQNIDKNYDVNKEIFEQRMKAILQKQQWERTVYDIGFVSPLIKSLKIFDQVEEKPKIMNKIAK